MVLRAHLAQFSIPIGFAVVTFAALWVMRLFFFRSLETHKVSTHPRWELWGRIASVLWLPSYFWVIALSLQVGLLLSPFPAQYIIPLARSIEILLDMSLAVVGANALEALFGYSIRGRDATASTYSLIRTVIKASVYLLALVIILSRLGVRVEPLVAALGIGGLAIGLALQDTLTNLFAGVNLLLERAIQMGDTVRLESGWEGVVEDIGWRTSRIRLKTGDLLIIPNVKLAQGLTIRKQISAS